MIEKHYNSYPARFTKMIEEKRFDYSLNYNLEESKNKEHF